jgi:hypothetical protein
MATKKSLEELKIYNDWGYADGNPFIYYQSTIYGRGYRSAGWCITWPNHAFKVAWYDHGNIVIDVWKPSTEKEIKLEEAKQKFKEIFKCEEELVPTPFGGWMPKSFVEKRNKEIKEMIRKNKNG